MSDFWSDKQTFGGADVKFCIDDHIVEQENLLISATVDRFKPKTLNDIGCGNPKRLRDIVYGKKIRPVLHFFDKYNFDSSVHELDITYRAANPADMVLACRILGNVSEAHRRAAFKNLYDSVNEGGVLVLIEGFQRQRENIQQARTELGYPGLPPSSSGSTMIRECEEEWLEEIFGRPETYYIAPDYTIWTRLHQRDLLPFGSAAAQAFPAYGHKQHGLFAMYQMRIYRK